MSKKNGWVKETKRILERHKSKGKYMNYVLPLEKDTTCVNCHRRLKKGTQVLHKYDGLKTIEVFCDECYKI